MAKRAPPRLLLWLAAIGLLVFVALGVAVGLLLGAHLPSPVAGAEARWLLVRLDHRLADAPGSEGMVTDPSQFPPLTTEVAAALRHAAGDERVAGLVLELSPLAVGWAQVDELRDALRAFRASGRPCVAWATTYTNKEYALAAACGEVAVAPAGLLLVNGLRVSRLYYRDALDALGVRPNLEHVGEFKSAVEPYERTGPSPYAQEATDALLDSLYRSIFDGVAADRGLSPERMRALLDRPPLTPLDAEEAGLVDRVAWRDEIVDERVGDDPIRFPRYLARLRGEWSSGHRRIAVLHLDGTIVEGRSDVDPFGVRTAGDRTLHRQIERLREDDRVVAVVLRVNSPGGSGAASDAIWRDLHRLAEDKPLVVSMADTAASGGYYVSTAAARIVAEPATLTGSIGVFGGKLNFRGLFEKLGVRVHATQRGRHAGLLAATSDFDEEERRAFRRFLGVFYQLFLERVAEGRGIDLARAHRLGRGRVWTGEQALANGLVDELGGLDVAIRRAAELAGVEREEVGILRLPQRRTLVERLLRELTESDDDARAARALVGALPPDVREALRAAAELEAALGTGGVVAMMPGRVVVE